MSRRRAASHLGCVSLAACLMTACAARGFTPPADAGVPLAAFVEIHSSLTAACASVRTFTAELGLAGRAGSERLRGRVVAGFMRPDAMRLEGVAPFGPPAFVLVSSAGVATLVLPRDNAVLPDAPPAQVLEALTGVALEPADLQAVLTGCVTPGARPSAGRLHGNGSATIATDSGTTFYLQRERDGWRLRAARRDQWLIEYPTWQGSFPSVVRLRSTDAPRAVDLTATVAQLESNVDLDAEAFSVAVSATATRISLDDLRQGGPLRDQP
jgi:outer membrane biogenesis lipoprotein LolB